MSRLIQKQAIPCLMLGVLIAGICIGSVARPIVAQAPPVDPRIEIRRLSQELSDRPTENVAIRKLPDRVAALLVAKRDSLRLSYEAYLAMYEAGAREAGLQEIIRARSAWIDADLQLNNEPAHRIKLLRELVDSAARLEAEVIQKSEFGAAGGTQALVYVAQAARFDAEVRLARELIAQSERK